MAITKAMEHLREKDQLKDDLNKELESKVEERTIQIQKMNELLKSHNIQLESEIRTVNEARVFSQVMDYKAFQKIFPNDEACYQYLSKLKWKQNETTSCKKCGYQNFPSPDSLSIRCGRCRYLESTTAGTLFQNIKFPLLKAFYITYRISTLPDDSTTSINLSKEINLRTGTLLIFKKRILSLMEETQYKKKHKDGWTHLIEYSIKHS
jgi:hypothetical protein